jgi:Predicted lactoylglutathione lyase
MSRIFDHIDLRVPDLAAARKFYDRLLPRLGFTVEQKIPGWVSYHAPGEGPTEFFGFIESRDFRPNENRIAFRADSNASVDAFPPFLREIGAKNIEGPCFEEEGYYYAIFFEDPFGNRLEICHRLHN